MEFRLKIAGTLVAAALSWASPALATQSMHRHHNACNYENISCQEVVAPAKPPSMLQNALPKALTDWQSELRLE